MSVFEWMDAPRADFAVVGDPVEHSLSPAMHQAAYAALGIHRSFVAIRVKQGDLKKALNHMGKIGYVGANVTLPLKEEAAAWAKDPEPFVVRTNSANAIRFVDGGAINTDAPAFLETLAQLNVPHGATVLLLGAGGAARALAVALEDAGYRLRLFNRTAEKAKAMTKSLALKAELLKEPDPSGAAAIVNATSASISGASVPVQWQRGTRGAIAYDLAYGSELSLFLLHAGLAGMKVVDGREMLIAQGARSFEWWLGGRAPVEAMRQAVL